MTALDSSKPKNRSRPLLRFSLRAMLLVLTASALWLGWKADRVHRQKQAVGWLREHDESIFWDYKLHAGRLDPPTEENALTSSPCRP